MVDFDEGQVFVFIVRDLDLQSRRRNHEVVRTGAAPFVAGEVEGAVSRHRVRPS